jgi:hypothetical protein
MKILMSPNCMNKPLLKRTIEIPLIMDYTTQINSEDKLKQCPKVKFAVQLEPRV